MLADCTTSPPTFGPAGEGTVSDTLTSTSWERLLWGWSSTNSSLTVCNQTVDALLLLVRRAILFLHLLHFPLPIFLYDRSHRSNRLLGWSSVLLTRAGSVRSSSSRAWFGVSQAPKTSVLFTFGRLHLLKRTSLRLWSAGPPWVISRHPSSEPSAKGTEETGEEGPQPFRAKIWTLQRFSLGSGIIVLYNLDLLEHVNTVVLQEHIIKWLGSLPLTSSNTDCI